MNSLQNFMCCIKWGKQNRQLIKLWENGEARIENEFDMVKIIQKLNSLDIWFENINKKDKTLKFLIKNNKRNIINLEDSDHEHEGDEAGTCSSDSSDEEEDAASQAIDQMKQQHSHEDKEESCKDSIEEQ